MGVPQGRSKPSFTVPPARDQVAGPVLPLVTAAAAPTSMVPAVVSRP